MAIYEYRLHDETYTYVPHDDELAPLPAPSPVLALPRGETSPTNPHGLTVLDIARYVLSLPAYLQYEGWEKRMLLNRLGEDEQ